MALRTIITYPDPRLRDRSQPVTDFGPSLQSLAQDLTETLAEHSAFGLSAPQLADHRAIFVIAPPGTDQPQLFINPEVTSKAAWGFVEESCLSVPGLVGSVIRATQITVRAQDAEGAPFERALDGMAAVCVQHELDHLEGRLFFDRFSALGRLRAKRRLRHLTSDNPQN